MTLEEFRQGRGWTLAELARELGLHDARSVHRYLHGQRIPRAAVMRRIMSVTGGAVSPADFYQAAPPVQRVPRRPAAMGQG
ncbi:MULTISPECIES: helix-turn-helix domain-containing protein [Roseomonadaceae]|jgi:transcriptional regulator with XRE-family HTH domain|uniref:Helix-turn-helix transcriptional regulator n=1 Tax=Falsiroseomonas oleicola TaxID=2801474 RepID=A0ABS6HEU0_9PROT|nr:helix-turn-helix transcriptional regulator [Roseomonas oleicola]MBU8547264.1 helix-turn-helix transcriptional regulator [Roseomonas oleicola]